MQVQQVQNQSVTASYFLVWRHNNENDEAHASVSAVKMVELYFLRHSFPWYCGTPEANQ